MKTLDIYTGTAKGAVFLKKYVNEIIKINKKERKTAKYIWRDDDSYGDEFLMLSRGIDCFVFNLNFQAPKKYRELGYLDIKSVDKEGKYVVVEYELEKISCSEYVEQLIKNIINKKDSIDKKTYRLFSKECAENVYVDINSILKEHGKIIGLHLIDILKLATYDKYPTSIDVHFTKDNDLIYISFPYGFVYAATTRDFVL